MSGSGWISKGRAVGRLLVGTAVFVMLVAAVSLPACTSDGGATTTTSTTGAVASTTTSTLLTIEEALALKEGEGVWGAVEGRLVSTLDDTRLCSALLESYPPQCGGASIAVQGLDLDSLVGLQSTAKTSGLASVTWSDYPVKLMGVVRDGVLQCEDVDQRSLGAAKEVPGDAAVGSYTVRLGFGPLPLTSGAMVWWTLDFTNKTDAPVKLVFSSGQKGEIVLSQGGVEKYRWSAGKAFTEAVEEVVVQPGMKWSAVFNDPLTVAPGEYEVVGTISAAADSAVPLPEVRGTLVVE